MMSDLQQRYAQIQKALNHGCHDRACVIEKTTGMVTNGGCDCLRDLSFVDRQRVGQLLLLGQEAIAQLAEAEANCDAELTAALMASEERHKADKLAAMERVREAAAKACICTIAERRIDNSLEHERRIEARIRALDVADIAKEVK